jgi:hypothetical protein
MVVAVAAVGTEPASSAQNAFGYEALLGTLQGDHAQLCLADQSASAVVRLTMGDDQRRPAPPTELRIWNWLSLVLLALFFGLAALTQSRWVAAAVLVAGGLVQLFGGLAALNRGGLADRLARYYTQRPVMLGGFIVNRYGLSWRLQGASIVLLGAALIAGAAMLVH